LIVELVALFSYFFNSALPLFVRQLVQNTFSMASGPLEVEANKSLSSQEIENACEESAPSFSPEEEAVPVRKIDLMLLPTMGVMYFLSYMDRTK
jgi:hypothetical protein